MRFFFLCNKYFQNFLLTPTVPPTTNPATPQTSGNSGSFHIITVLVVSPLMLCAAMLPVLIYCLIKTKGKETYSPNVFLCCDSWRWLNQASDRLSRRIWCSFQESKVVSDDFNSKIYINVWPDMLADINLVRIHLNTRTVRCCLFGLSSVALF